jgi:hypothetical protein
MSSSTACRLILKINFPQQIRNAGWTESYDMSFADLPTAVANGNKIAAFVWDRLQCLGIGPLMVSGRIYGFVQPTTPGAPPVRRSSVPMPLPNQPQHGTCYNKAFSVADSPTTPYSSDYATSDLYLNLTTTLSSTPVYQRNLWLAGLPDIADLTSSNVLTDSLTKQAVQTFIDDLTGVRKTLAGQCGICIRSVDRSGGNAIKPCTGWTTTAPLQFTVPAHGFALGQPVQALGMSVAPGGYAPRGRYLVSQIIDANTIALAGVNQLSPAIKTGGFRPSIVTFNPVQVALIQGMTKRDKGRPFGLSVGRRPKRRTQRA